MDVIEVRQDQRGKTISAEHNRSVAAETRRADERELGVIERQLHIVRKRQALRKHNLARYRQILRERYLDAGQAYAYSRFLPKLA